MHNYYKLNLSLKYRNNFMKKKLLIISINTLTNINRPSFLLFEKNKIIPIKAEIKTKNSINNDILVIAFG